MRKTTASFFLLTVTVLTVAALLSWPAERWATVKTTRIILGGVEKTVAVTGTAARKGEYHSAHPSGGVVAQVYVREGQTVVKGQALYRLEDTVQRTALQKALKNLDAAKAAEKTQQERVQEAFANDEQMLAAAQAVAGTYEEKRAVLESQIESLQMEIEALTQRAYQDGQVLQILVREGELLLPGSPGAVLATQTAEVRAQVVARDALQIREGMQAYITLNDAPLAQAVVEQVGLLTPNSQGISYAQVSLLPKDGLSVPVGTQVDVEIILRSQEGVWVAPVDALTKDNAVWQVYKGRAWKQPAVTGLWDDNYTTVENLGLGTEIILNPDENLRDGMRVKVVKP